MQPQPPQIVFDKMDQVRQLEQVLLPDEVIEAVFDVKGAGAGFIGITSKRVVFHDKQFLRKLKGLYRFPTAGSPLSPHRFHKVNPLIIAQRKRRRRFMPSSFQLRSRRRLFRRRNDAELLHQPQHVHLNPVLHKLAILDAPEAVRELIARSCGA